MKTFIFLILLMTLTTDTSFAQTPPVEAGVSQKLAQWRAAHYSDVRYKLSITLEKGAPLMKGEIEIRVNIDAEGAKSDLVLDWRTTQFANDKDKPFAYLNEANGKVFNNMPLGSLDMPTHSIYNEHLVVLKRFLKSGENVFKIQFASPVKTSGGAITRYIDREDGAEYVYSLFVPSDASTAIPVFDQPDLKARFSLILAVPMEWKAISNTEVEKVGIENLVIPPTNEKPNGESRRIHHHLFKETKPISTYVFAFAAGDFVSFTDKNSSKIPPVELATMPKDVSAALQDMTARNSVYVRKSQAEKFKQHSAETFRLNREAVKYLESYFDFKFPFPKYDLVLIPEFPFNGMEHAGATFIRETSVIFPSEPTKNDFISRANVIFHEAAHQWFGDTVTMKWFDDLWLKEGFAEFMAYKTLEKTMPEYNAWKAFYERNKPLAYLTDATRGTTPIYQEIPNLSAAKSAYGNIVYRKAPSFLRQAEFYLGEDKFQTAVRAFLKKYQYKNAEWTDLVREFEAASGQDLKNWAKAWVTQRGMPKISVEIRKDIDVTPQGSRALIILASGVGLKQTNALNESGLWTMKTNFLSKFRDGRTEEHTVIFEGKSSTDSGYLHKGNEIPQFVFPNYQDYGYGVFLLDKQSREYILENIRNEKDDFLRSMMWGALWDSVREAELNPKDYVELAIKNISVETDELTISTILNRVSTAMNYYLSDTQRAELTPKFENLLIEKMRNAPTVGQRITFYRAFLNISSSEKARMFLKDILSGKSQIKDLKLKTKDKFDIVTRLAVLGDADAPKLLDELAKTETSDDAKRYVYAVGAAFPNKEAKEKYFNDFLNNKEISESWIESAFVPFNSPRHSELTLIYLERALAELPNLKRSRKIFFINGWLASFIGGQKDEKALAIVNKFLADNPTLDKDLRLKILENVDTLERAVKIRLK
jgi:aminopeptidase N